MFDGLDEVANDAGRILLGNIISDLSREYPKNQYIVTSRPISNEILSHLMLKDVKRVEITSLTEKARYDFVEKWRSVIEQALHSAGESYSSLNTSHFLRSIGVTPGTQELAANPFVLGIMLMLQYLSSDNRNVTRVELYKRYLKDFLRRCDYVSDLDIQTMYERLEYLAFRMHQDNTNNVNLPIMRDIIVQHIISKEECTRQGNYSPCLPAT